MNARKHHYVPETYLNGFVDPRGQLHVYRKDDPQHPFLSSPSATGFSNYYYAFEKNDGTFDSDSLETIFSRIETKWPEYVYCIENNEPLIGGRFREFLEFVALQRARVPATRDMYELMQSDHLLATAKYMLSRGMLPPPPPGKENILDRIEISVAPQSSLQAISIALKACEKVFSRLNYIIFRNEQGMPFLTSDNPVIWFQPAPEDQIEPYNIRLDGPIELFFPITQKFLLYGRTPFGQEDLFDGVVYRTSESLEKIELANRHVVRFASATVFACTSQCSSIVERHAHMSPVLQTTTIPTTSGQAVVGRMRFAPRRTKAKWTPPSAS